MISYRGLSITCKNGFVNAVEKGELDAVNKVMMLPFRKSRVTKSRKMKECGLEAAFLLTNGWLSFCEN